MIVGRRLSLVDDFLRHDAEAAAHGPFPLPSHAPVDGRRAARMPGLLDIDAGDIGRQRGQIHAIFYRR